LFKHLLSTPEGKESLALTRVLTSYETAIGIDSPRGLFLSGEVGTGKSMLLDLLADGLPTNRKKRWHFNTFMLYTLSQLEGHRRLSSRLSDAQSEFSLVWMAKKMIEESPILFLDEFQLPDRAASKILSQLFVAFFQLGGVLIASSNRMPEELQKATGVDHTRAPGRGLISKIFGNGELFGQTSDFANFLEVLKARCDFWHMEGARDWRRREETDITGVVASDVGSTGELVAAMDASAETGSTQRKKPHYYYMLNDTDASWQERMGAAVGWHAEEPIPWASSNVTVYGRQVTTPNHYKGCVYWNFDDLVESFGPADYITMASTYHTFIIDNVPILTLLKKNEARRFITLLDALYEARCKLIVRAENPPDDLFFPEKPARSKSQRGTVAEADDDATYSETIAEVYQDQTSPFRPNVSYYDGQTPTAKYDPDQDSDFGLEKRPVDFGNTSAFTGEDERFAYKRATSRLWELCSAQWHARTGDWWQPLPVEARHWEGGQVSQRQTGIVQGYELTEGEGMGVTIEIEEIAGLSRWRVEDLQKQDTTKDK
jgi:predicted ATPase